MEVKSEGDPMEIDPNTSQDNSELVKDVLECELSDPLTTSSGAQFRCSECQALFDTREKCIDHKAVVHSPKENQVGGGLKQELQKCERWYVDKCREIAMAPREVCLETKLSSSELEYFILDENWSLTGWNNLQINLLINLEE